MFWKKPNWLVSCCNEKGGLFSLDPRDGTHEKLLDEDCRGIARYKNHFVLVTISAGILLLDERYQVVQTSKAVGPDGHGVAVKGDLAYVIETHRNAIGVYRLPDLQKVRDIQLHPEEEDVLHMNDLFIEGNRLFVSMFSLDGHWRPKKDVASGGIKEFDMESMRETTVHFPEAIHHPHSVRWYEEKLWYCSSYPRHVRHDDTTFFRVSGYSRGLHVDARYIGIGNSCTRWNKGEYDQAGVYVYRRADRSSRFLELPATEVYGILA